MNKNELTEMLDYICRDSYYADELEDVKKSIKEDYIEKQKIKDKIEELLNQNKNITEEQRQKDTMFLQGKLKAYEELLEEE